MCRRLFPLLHSTIVTSGLDEICELGKAGGERMRGELRVQGHWTKQPLYVSFAAHFNGAQ